MRYSRATLAERKAAAIMRSDILRRSLELQILPLRRHMDMAEAGLVLARQLLGSLTRPSRRY